jgi:hypothetical protein
MNQTILEICRNVQSHKHHSPLNESHNSPSKWAVLIVDILSLSTNELCCESLE